MLYLDFEKAQQLVNEAIAEKGENYVYEKEGNSCHYVHGVTRAWDSCKEDYVSAFDDATTGCLVGHALKLGGVPLEVMGKGMHNDSDAQSLLKKLESTGFITAMDKVRWYLTNLQQSQDLGTPWGRAAEAAARGKVVEPILDDACDPTGEYTESDGIPLSDEV
jgi:hypothetical protein